MPSDIIDRVLETNCTPGQCWARQEGITLSFSRKDPATKSDEFLEKFQTAFDSPLPLRSAFFLAFPDMMILSSLLLLVKVLDGVAEVNKII